MSVETAAMEELDLEGSLREAEKICEEMRIPCNEPLITVTREELLVCIRKGIVRGRELRQQEIDHWPGWFPRWRRRG